MRKKVGETDIDIDMLACAYLAGEEKKQIEIAEILGLSQATVSRLLKQARKKYLKEEVRFLREEVDDEMMEKILHRAARKRLGNELDELAKRYTGLRGPILRVFPSSGKGGAVSEWGNRLLKFSPQAAPFVKDLLVRANLCGVSWGTTVRGIVSALQKISLPPPRANTPIRVIPLCGEPLGNLPTSFSSSNLAADIEIFLNGDNKETFSLGMVPAFIPDNFTRAQLEGIWQLIGLVEGYNRIFGKNTSKKSTQVPLVEELDTVLTSVSSSDRPLALRGSALFRTIGNIDLKMLGELVIGDISGVCIPRPGLNKADRAKVDQVNKRWTGIRREHLEACARRSALSDLLKGPPGIIVIAFGKNKAECVFECIKLGLANVLLVDDDLEEELERLVKLENSQG